MLLRRCNLIDCQGLMGAKYGSTLLQHLAVQADMRKS